MLEATHPSTRFHGDLVLSAADLKDPMYQAYKLLHVGFTIALPASAWRSGHGFSPTLWRLGFLESS